MSERLPDSQLARDYLVWAASIWGSPVHPDQKANAVSWVRLCGLRAVRDPSAWLDTPWRREIMDAALDVVGDET